jgi:hypothetical protein
LGILLLFAQRRTSGADDPDDLAAVSMDYHYQQLGSGLPDRDGACFIGGMVWIRNVAAKGSPNTVDASSNDTPCFLKFASALRGSHSKRTATCYREGTFNAMSAEHQG